MTRLGTGEYDFPDGRFSTDYARQLFLWCAGNLVPELKPSLASAVEAAGIEGVIVLVPANPANRPPRLDLDDLLLRARDERQTLEQALQPWQKRWNLSEDWVFQMIAGALRHPNNQRRGRTAAEWVMSSWQAFEPVERDGPIYPPNDLQARLLTGGNPEIPDLEFSARWYPQHERRTDISRWLKARFARELTAYLDAIETETEAAGMKRTPSKRGRRGASSLLHFEWLARFQVQEWSHGHTAKWYEVSEKAIADACRSTAELIGLVRRTVQDPPG